jgi:hypothetical protein
MLVHNLKKLNNFNYAAIHFTEHHVCPDAKLVFLCRFDLQLLSFTQILFTIAYSKLEIRVTGNTAP